MYYPLYCIAHASLSEAPLEHLEDATDKIEKQNFKRRQHLQTDYKRELQALGRL